MMSEKDTIDRSVTEALDTVENFITQTTGERPTQQEIANALKRYFVLSEIKSHIVMEREASE